MHVSIIHTATLRLFKEQSGLTEKAKRKIKAKHRMTHTVHVQWKLIQSPILALPVSWTIQIAMMTRYFVTGETSPLPKTLMLGLRQMYQKNRNKLQSLGLSSA